MSAILSIPANPVPVSNLTRTAPLKNTVDNVDRMDLPTTEGPIQSQINGVLFKKIDLLAFERAADLAQKAAIQNILNEAKNELIRCDAIHTAYDFIDYMETLFVSVQKKLEDLGLNSDQIEQIMERLSDSIATLFEENHSKYLDLAIQIEKYHNDIYPSVVEK